MKSIFFCRRAPRCNRKSERSEAIGILDWSGWGTTNAHKFCSCGCCWRLILLTLWGLKAADLRRDNRKWDWNVFIAIFVVMAVMNIVWPFGSP